MLRSKVYVRSARESLRCEVTINGTRVPLFYKGSRHLVRVIDIVRRGREGMRSLSRENQIRMRTISGRVLHLAHVSSILFMGDWIQEES